MAKSVAERQRDHRARKKLEKEIAAQSAPKEHEIEAVLADHEADLAWAQEFDATGQRYKSECRKLVDLLAIYEGANILDKEDDEEDETDKRKKAKKKENNRPAPYKSKFKIRSTTLIDDSMGQDLKIEVPIDPNTFEYKKVNGEVVNCKLVYDVDGSAPISFRRWLDLRDKGRKDLFWLGRLLGCSLFAKTHQMICDMFVKKDFDGLYFEDYNRDDIHDMIARQKRFAVDGKTPTRTMLLFAPRSGYKSTVDGLDVVQWMLNCPDIRVMIMTNVKGLAKMFMGEIKSYFYLPKRGAPSAFQILFPEYILTGIDGKSKEPIRCPAAAFSSKEPNVWITSMDASSTGSRCDIRKMDDIVDDKNSADDELRESLKEKVKATNNLVEGWGFTDVIGTRYFTKDWYGWRMSKDEHGNDPEPYAYLSISAWTPKPEFKTRYQHLLNTPNGVFDVTEEMVDLWFPSKLSFARLRSLLKENKERVFKNQQLNIATDPDELDNYINQFDLDVLRAHSYQRGAAPQEITIIQCWDIAYGEQRTSDYSVGVTLGIYKNKHNEFCVVVIEVFFDKWKASELAANFVKYYEKHRPTRVYLENSNGVQFFKENLSNFVKRSGSDLMHNLICRPVSSKPNAKRDRIKDVEFLLGHDRLWFVLGEWIDETFKQLTEYNGKKSTTYRKDDIPDAIALGVVSHLPITALQHNPDPKDVEKEHEEMEEKVRREAWKNRMFGGHNPTKPATAPTPAPAQPPRDSRQEVMKKLIGKILPPGMRV